jgi:hypothetical protein
VGGKNSLSGDTHKRETRPGIARATFRAAVGRIRLRNRALVMEEHIRDARAPALRGSCGWPGLFSVTWSEALLASVGDEGCRRFKHHDCYLLLRVLGLTDCI